MTERMPNTFLIGAGQVATALAGALRHGGVPVLGLWARRADAAMAAGESAGVAFYTGAFPSLLAQSDAVIVAVRERAVAAVAERLLDERAIGAQAVLLHCSGASPSEEVFASVRDRVGGVGTIHPLRAIADGKAVARSMPGTVFGVEGDAHGRATAMALVTAMHGVPLALEAEQMAAYHAAAAIASNYVVALLDTAVDVLERLGMSERAATEALVPLARGSLENFAARGSVEGLTGPIRRGDRATVQRHLDALPPESRDVYRALGLRTLALARRAGEAAEADLDAIAELLADSATRK